MLRMRIERAPLKDAENEVILREYNRLTNAGIPMSEFVHWVANSPAGKAWHGILEAEDGRVVGHTSVFPFRIGFASGSVIPAKSEFSLLHEDFRKEKIVGFEKAGKSAFIVLLDHVFRHSQEFGWGPIFASTNERNQVFTRKVGLRPVEFPLWECLLILKPRAAAQFTPNMNEWQRRGILSTGIAQVAIRSMLTPFLSHRNGVREIPMGASSVAVEGSRLAFFEDVDSLRWRYLDGQYARLQIEQSPGDYVIVKRGSPTKYVRVCQWHIGQRKQVPSFISALIGLAQRDGALGVRWAVYDGEPMSDALVTSLKWAGFLAARRTRIVMVHKLGEKYLDRSLWKMNDSLFSFDP